MQSKRREERMGQGTLGLAYLPGLVSVRGGGDKIALLSLLQRYLTSVAEYKHDKRQ